MDCQLCFKSLEDKTKIKISCGHKYHLECYDEHIKYNSHCPICNNEINDFEKGKDLINDDYKKMIQMIKEFIN